MQHILTYLFNVADVANVVIVQEKLFHVLLHVDIFVILAVVIGIIPFNGIHTAIQYHFN